MYLPFPPGLPDVVHIRWETWMAYILPDKSGHRHQVCTLKWSEPRYFPDLRRRTTGRLCTSSCLSWHEEGWTPCRKWLTNGNSKYFDSCFQRHTSLIIVWNTSYHKVRGSAGEHSEAEGGKYDISNRWRRRYTIFVCFLNSSWVSWFRKRLVRLVYSYQNLGQTSNEWALECTKSRHVGRILCN